MRIAVAVVVSFMAWFTVNYVIGVLALGDLWEAFLATWFVTALAVGIVIVVGGLVIGCLALWSWAL